MEDPSVWSSISAAVVKSLRSGARGITNGGCSLLAFKKFCRCSTNKLHAFHWPRSIFFWPYGEQTSMLWYMCYLGVTMYFLNIPNGCKMSLIQMHFILTLTCFNWLVKFSVRAWIKIMLSWNDLMLDSHTVCCTLSRQQRYSIEAWTAVFNGWNDRVF